MASPRLSIAGLMTVVAFAALDCAILGWSIDLLVRSSHMGPFLLLGVFPLTNIIGIGVLLLLQPRPRR
jgi:hypothetical protein